MPDELVQDPLMDAKRALARDQLERQEKAKAEIAAVCERYQVTLVASVTIDDRGVSSNVQLRPR